MESGVRTRPAGAVMLNSQFSIFHCLLCVLAVSAFRTVVAQPDGEFARLMNIGKAQLENRNSAQAIESFTAALKLDPKSAPALRNLARAQLLARKPELALEPLNQAGAVEAESAATSYLTGLAHARLSRFEDAVPHFENAVRLDANTATLRFQLASCYQAAERHDKAVEQLKETVRLDPMHASAHYKLAGYARKAGDQAEFERRNVEFTRLRKLLGQPPSAEVLEMCIQTQPEPPPIPPATTQKSSPAIDVCFVDATKEAFGEGEASAVAAAILEMAPQGRYTLFVATPGGQVQLLKMGPDGKFQRTQVGPPLSASEEPFCCIIGDYHNDVPTGAKYDPAAHARNDVLLINEKAAYLLMGTAAPGFDNVTAVAGLAGLTGRRACWVDYEHDGDLDLAIVRKEGLSLHRNNGDGTFTQVSAEAGIPATGAVTDAALADFDGNVAIDMVVARGAAPTLVLQNQRAGKLALMPEPPGPWPPAWRVLADDLNNDGRTDVLLVGEKDALTMLTGLTERTGIDLAGMQASDAALLDFDNDGRLDLCAVGATDGAAKRGAVRLWRNAGNAAWQEATQTAKLDAFDAPPVVDAMAADLDADGDTDLLLLTTDQKLRRLRNDGGHVNGQLKVRLSGTKTNPAGIGTHVELRDGDFWVTRGVTGPVIEIGLGGRKRLDAVQTVWTNGVVDNQINVSSTPTPLSIVEKNVAAGSCPFLYAWDGQRFRFVTDLLGNSPVGLPLSRGKLLPADPDEYVWVGDERSVRTRAGAYAFEVTSEFREVLYLDEARLVAVDHPSDVEVHPTDKLMPSPFPASELVALDKARAAYRAVGDDGVDRTEALRAIDGDFAPPGAALPPPLRGMCQPLTITLDFGALDPERPYVLALTGWLQYGDASANIAMSQNGAIKIVPPALEVEAGTGKWQPVNVVVGMPAGKTKTIVCDLAGKLPPDARKLRLSTTFEIRWDRIALSERHSGPRLKVHEASADGADLRFRGFSDLRSRAAGHAATPDYATVHERPAWRTSVEGWCTRYGDVRELIARRDGELVIVNGGDALALHFDATAFPSIPADKKRTYFFYSVGWDKDADYNVVEGDTVDPLPTEVVGAPGTNPHASGGPNEPKPAASDDDWRVRYNTRWVPRDRFKE